jgi:hypothetical protein
LTRSTPIPETVTLHVPFRLVKRGGRKEMQLPEGVAQLRRTDNTLIKALARAFRWKCMLESGEFATIGELAEREGIAPSYMTRVLRLTLLAPDIVEAFLDGKQGPEVTLAHALEPFPAKWLDQPDHLGGSVEAAAVERRRDRPAQPRAVIRSDETCKRSAPRVGRRGSDKGRCHRVSCPEFDMLAQQRESCVRSGTLVYRLRCLPREPETRGLTAPLQTHIQPPDPG